MSEQQVDISYEKVAGTLEHTILKPSAGPAEIEQLCREAVENELKGVCVNPWLVPVAAEFLQGKQPLVVSVVGFPLGASRSEIKAREAGLAVEQGADEVDMVINAGALLAGDRETVFEDIRAVVKAAAPASVKVIIETCLLDDARKREACLIARDAGAAFVKTSTGFGGGGATVEDIRLMRQTVSTDMGVKASGGIKTFFQATDLIQAGADRIGTSSSLEILAGFRSGGGL